MKNSPISPFLALLLYAAGVGTTLAQNALSKGWSEDAIFLANDARQDFVAARKDAKSDQDKREADFGEAVSLLNVQPKTDGNLDRADSLLKSVRAINPDDDLGIASLYFRARLEQYQRLPPNLPQATEYYRELMEKYPNHFFGQQGAIKLALLEIYGAATTKEQVDLLAKYDALAAKFTDPQSQRDMYYVLARTYMNLRLSPQKALDDLLKTQEFGFSLSGDRADNYVRIIELAAATNHPDIISTYLAKLITEFPFDPRIYTLKQQFPSPAPTSTASVKP